MSDAARVRNGALAIGLVQGLLLLAAQIFIEHNIWPLSTDGGRFAWYSVALAVPTMLVLVWNGGSISRLLRAGAVLTAVLIVLGAWSGSQTGTHSSSSAVVAPYILTTAIGWYVFLPFVQIWQAGGRWRFPYPQLFEHSWNNIFTLAIAAAIAGLFRGLLSLWAALFKIVGIELFEKLFDSKYFNYPVLATVFALALWLVRHHVQAVSVARRIVLTVFRGLLPLLAFIALLFLAELPFSGLAPLWRTGYATPLLVTLIVLMILFVNAVFQDGSGEPPYRPWLRRMVEAAVLLLPVYVGLAAFSLGLRVTQHGWSVERFWGMLVVVLAALYAMGYAVAVWRRRGAWLSLIGRVNVALAVVILALAVLVNSPLLDARGISVRSQVARLMDGQVTAEKFDYRYLRFSLGRAGEQALERLKVIAQHPEATLIRERSAAILEQVNPWDVNAETLTGDAQVLEHLVVFPRDHRVDPAFLAMLRKDPNDYRVRACFVRGRHCPLLAVDLNGDRHLDYVLILPQSEYSGGEEAVVLYSNGLAGWVRIGNLAVDADGSGNRTLTELEQLLERGDYQATAPDWQNLKLGGRTYRLRGW